MIPEILAFSIGCVVAIVVAIRLAFVISGLINSVISLGENTRRIADNLERLVRLKEQEWGDDYKTGRINGSRPRVNK